MQNSNLKNFICYSLLITSLLISISCNEKKNVVELYKAVDFTKEGEFTSGIEGPATDKAGNIYLVNYGKAGTIGKVNKEGDASLFVELRDGSIGNGIRISKDGHLLQPNDLALMDNGLIFTSDPNWSEGTGNLWRVNHDGTFVLLESNMGTTNGIEVSPDQKTLYVNESVQRKIWAYDLSSSGSVSNKREFYTFPDHGMDGMRCDIQGNLYVTRYGKGTVVILSPDAQLLQEISLVGKKPSNITFGGSDGKTCFITLQDRGCLESFRSEIEGREWK